MQPSAGRSLRSARERGADIRLNTAVRRLEAEGDRISGVVTDSGRMAGDVYVLAMGSWSTRLARTVGLRLPVQPVKGYSITAPVVDPALAPTVGGIDEEAYVGFSRQGELLRVAGSISYGGLDTRAGPTACAHIVRAARALFPAAADYDQAEFRACLRPQTAGRPANPRLGAAPPKSVPEHRAGLDGLVHERRLVAHRGGSDRWAYTRDRHDRIGLAGVSGRLVLASAAPGGEACERSRRRGAEVPAPRLLNQR